MRAPDLASRSWLTGHAARSVRPVSDPGACPYCGSPVDNGTGQTPGLGPLYREVRRIREIAETRASADDARRIAELTRQVRELRATVARLRGPGEPRLARAADAAAGRRAG
jgi:hypothetical protein